MDVIALAGGYGTRMGALTINKPKALLELAGKPLLTYTLSRINKLDDVGTIYIVSNNKFYGQLEDWKKTVKSRFPMRILNDGTNSNEDRLGAIGDLLFAIDKEKISSDILVVGTDNFFTFDFNALVLRSKETHASTVGLFDVKDREIAKRMGVVKLDKDDKVLSLIEKPADPPSTLCSMFLYYILANDFQHLRDMHKNHESDKMGPLIGYISEKSLVYGVVYEKPWYDIGSPEVYDKLNKELQGMR